MKSFCLLYASSLAPGVGAEVVAQITRSARLNNSRDGITGILVFDGEKFVQWVEGSQSAIDKLLARLRVDDRHTELDILIHEARSEPPLFPDWQLAFEVIDPSAGSISELAGLRGTMALDLFRQMIPQFDLEA